MTTRSSSPLRQGPCTRLGRLAVRLSAAFVGLFIVNSIVLMPLFMTALTAWWQQALLAFFGIFMMLCGLAGGVLGLTALVRKQERSWLVWLTILPLAFVLFLLLGEFLVPH